MAIPISAHLTFLLFSLTFSLYPLPISSLNITDLLSPYPYLSNFSALLAANAVAADLPANSSLTILAVPNVYLQNSLPTNLADVLRYHFILRRLSPSDLLAVPPAGELLTTLYHSVNVNVTRNSSGAVAFRSSDSKSAAALLFAKETLGYDTVSILSVDSLLVPSNPDLMASETNPPPPGLNLTKALIDAHTFNVAAAMLIASGLISEFEAAEGGAGITLFAPTDKAFSDLAASSKLQSLPADQKAVVLKYHVLRSYYPLGSLELIVNPVYPTLATEQVGAGLFTVNISRVDGSVAIGTGIVLASITQTVFDQKPVAIFGVSQVLLPKDYFGGEPIEVNKPSDVGAPPPDITLSPSTNGPSSNLSVPPGTGQSAVGVLRVSMGWWCIVLCYVLL